MHENKAKSSQARSLCSVGRNPSQGGSLLVGQAKGRHAAWETWKLPCGHMDQKEHHEAQGGRTRSKVKLANKGCMG